MKDWIRISLDHCNQGCSEVVSKTIYNIYIYIYIYIYQILILIADKYSELLRIWIMMLLV